MNLTKLYSAAKRPDAGGGIMFHLPDMGVAREVYPNRRIVAGTADGLIASDHGTMIAGILFDWCPNATLYSYSVASSVDALLTNSGRLLEAFDCILEQVKRYPAWRHIVCVSQATNNMGALQLERFHGQIRELAALGALIVCGAGNDGRLNIEPAKYPASWPEPVCVTACDNTGNRASFSSVRGEADCCAWGKDVTSRVSDGSVHVGSGTSYACPQVAGMAGMLWRQGMTAQDVWQRLKAACVDRGEGGCDPYYGWGVVDPTRFGNGEEKEQGMEQKESICRRFLAQAQSAVGGLYVWGGQGHKATAAYIKGRAAKYPQYFTGGRLAMMLRRAMDDPQLRCWDCSGLVCWALTECGAKAAGFDTTANGLYRDHCTAVTKDELRPGDLLFRKSGGSMTHVGVYTGPGSIEAAGGAYGVVTCEGLSGTAHTAVSHVDGKRYALPDWTDYGRLSCLTQTQAADSSGECAAAFASVTGNVYLRAMPEKTGAARGVVKKGSAIVVLPAQNGWHKAAAILNGKATGGYVSAKYVEVKRA